jgi:5'-3' exonuclease, N-terminal resolvase-like domain/T4 RNase H, C terminal
LIIVDLSQVMLSNLMMQLGNHTNAQVEENMIRHMVLNSLRSYKSKFGDEYGEMIIACDNTNYWRKQAFPYYKANRKKNRLASDLDWKSIFECMNKIRAELKEFFPYRVIDVESAEADDIIGTLVREFDDKILILSGDKDFVQLHNRKNIKQYDPTRKKWLSHNDPERFLKEHILKGDSGDGVPNVLSADNCFVVGDRQKPLTSKKFDHYMNLDSSKYDSMVARNYQRNKELIDLSFTPEEIRSKVIEQYNNQNNKDKSKLMNYFINNKLKNLMENIGDF